jgi:hypothetical protein
VAIPTPAKLFALVESADDGRHRGAVCRPWEPERPPTGAAGTSVPGADDEIVRSWGDPVEDDESRRLSWDT